MNKSILDFIGTTLALVVFWFLILFFLFENIMLPEVHYSVSNKSCVKVVDESDKNTCLSLPKKYNYVYVE